MAEAFVYSSDLDSEERNDNIEYTDYHIVADDLYRNSLNEENNEIRQGDEQREDSIYDEIEVQNENNGRGSIIPKIRSPIKRITKMFNRKKQKQNQIKVLVPLNRPISPQVDESSFVAVWPVFMGTLVKKYFGKSPNFDTMLSDIVIPRDFDQTKAELKKLKNYCFGLRAQLPLAPTTCRLMRKLSGSLEVAYHIENSTSQSPQPMDTLYLPTIFPKEYNAIHESIDKYKSNRSLSRQYSGEERLKNLERLKNVIFNHSNCRRFGLNPNDIFLANASFQSLFEAVQFFFQPGKNIVMPAPSVEFVEAICCLNGMEVKYYKLKPNGFWEVDFDDLESKIDKNTSAILIQNPNGVCGAVHTLAELVKIKEIAEFHQLPVISNEYFSHIIRRETTFHTFLEVAPNVPVVIVNSCFKRLFHKEYNIGWLALYDKENKLEELRNRLKFIEEKYHIERFIDFDIVSQLLTHHLPRALSCFCDFVDVNVKFASSSFRQCPGVKCIEPHGGWFMLLLLNMESFSQFSSDVDICHRLFEEESLKISPGSSNEWPGSLKLSLLVDRHKFVEICDRLVSFFRKYAKTEI